MKYNNSHGLTLIEVLIYLALYTIIMAGVLTSVYATLESSERNNTRGMLQEEGDFVLEKIDWALTGLLSISVPAPNTSGDTLSLIKQDTTVGNPVIIRRTASGEMTITRSGTTYTLTNGNVSVTCVSPGCFTHTAGSGDGINPESISAHMIFHATTSDGFPITQDFTSVMFMRK